MTIVNRTGKRISALRKEQGLSQTQLAALAGLDRGFVSEIENGKKNISIVTLEKISKALETKMSALLGEDQD